MKRLLPAALTAMGIHVLVLSLQVSWTPPTLMMPQSHSVTINLVQAAVAPPKEAPVQTPKPPEPSPKVKPSQQPKPEPKVKPVPQPKTLPAPEPRPVDDPAPEPNEPTSVQSVDTFEVTQEDTAAHKTNPSEPMPDDRQGAIIQSSKPRYDINPSPVYPTVARRRGYEGTVILSVLVTPLGQAVSVRIAHSSGYRILDERAVSTVQTWLFTPALQGSKPVSMTVQVPVVFQLQ